MQIFLTGTDTDVGKTTVASWLCLHTGYAYYKPIQAGVNHPTPISHPRERNFVDSQVVKNLANVKTLPETYLYPEPVSPHLAAALSNDHIDCQKIILPAVENLIVEGAGGVMVPINEQMLMIDLIKQLALPVIIVARSSLGTINHTLLTLGSLRNRDIPILGVIVNGEANKANRDAIAKYSKVEILAELPKLDILSTENLQKIPLPEKLKKLITT